MGPWGQSSGTGPNERCGNCCPLYPKGVGTRGKYFEPQGVNGHRRPVPGAPSGGTPRESQGQDHMGL